jgi:hypothetical protein
LSAPQALRCLRDATRATIPNRIEASPATPSPALVAGPVNGRVSGEVTGATVVSVASTEVGDTSVGIVVEVVVGWMPT